MGNIEALGQINLWEVFIGMIIILLSFCFIVETIIKVWKHIKKPIDWKVRNDEDHKILIETSAAVKRYEENTKQITEDIKILNDMFVNKEIEDMRWRILDFSSAVSNGRKFNRESYDFVFRTYDQYEKILKKLDMENGLVEESMKFIRETYQDGLKNGAIK